MTTTSPTVLAVSRHNRGTVRFVEDHVWIKDIAEIGVYQGHTAERLLPIVSKRGGSLHLFDYADVLDAVRARLGTDWVTYHPNTRRTFDSYCWSLARMITSGPCLDYAFIDGAHTLAIDGLAFVLVDRLLRTGGYVDFDDYRWTIASSPTHNPEAFPPIVDLYTPEQIRARQVKMVVDLLVRGNRRYVEVVPNKVFRKVH